MNVDAMLRTHPCQIQPDVSSLTRCTEACFDCAQTCSSCADACLGEPQVGELVRCIRLNLDCADVCAATGKLLSRQTEGDWAVVRAQLEACAKACAACGAECEGHADHMVHCKVCAEACRRCEEACRDLLGSLPA